MPMIRRIVLGTCTACLAGLKSFHVVLAYIGIRYCSLNENKSSLVIITYTKIQVDCCLRIKDTLQCDCALIPRYFVCHRKNKFAIGPAARNAKLKKLQPQLPQHKLHKSMKINRMKTARLFPHQLNQLWKRWTRVKDQN